MPFPLKKFLQRKPKPNTEQRVYPATHPAHAVLVRLGEYNPKIQGREWFLTVDKMRNNSRIMALEYILTLPIVATHWEVYPPKNPSRVSREAAELLNKDLLERCRLTLHELLRLAILARFYGIRALEPVYGVDEGRVYLVDIADIHPATYHRIELDERGVPTRLVQRVHTKDGVHEAVIPWGDLLVFTWRKEGGDPLGYPDLRPLYPDWYRLEFLYSVLSVAAERAGIGAWQATLPRNLYDNQALRSEMLAILKSIRSYEGGALILPEGVTVEVLKAVEHQGIESILRIAQHYETNLATAILANILQLGMREVGTQALAQVLFDMFLFQLNHTARWLADTINTGLVRQWMAYNYPQLPPEQHPNLQFTDLRLLLKREAVVDAVVKTIQSGVIPADANLQDYIRDILSLPPPSQSQSPVLQNPAPDRGRIHLQRRDPLRREREFQGALRAYLQSVQTELARQLNPLMAAVRSASSESERAEAIAQLQAVRLPDGAQDYYESLVYDYLYRFAVEARAALQRDYNRNIDPDALPASLVAYLRAKAHALAEEHTARLRSQVVYGALGESLKSVATLTPEELVRNLVSQRLNMDLASLEGEARMLLERINEDVARYD